MEIRKLLELAGESPLHNFPWAEDALKVINAVLPTDKQLSVASNGSDVLATVLALPETVHAELLSSSFDLSTAAGVVLDEIDAATTDPVKAKSLKLKVVLGLVGVMGIVFVLTALMTIGTAIKSGQVPDLTMLKEVGKILFQMLDMLMGFPLPA